MPLHTSLLLNSLFLFLKKMSISHSQVYILMLSFAAEAVLDSSISPLLPFIVAFLEKNSENIGAKVFHFNSGWYSSIRLLLFSFNHKYSMGNPIRSLW